MSPRSNSNATAYGERTRAVTRILLPVCCAMVLGAVQIPPEHLTVFMIGDSTMADKPLEGNPERGWGQIFARLFGATVTVENHARNGRSTRAFLAEDRWRPIVEKLKPGDYVFIQFGHNDQSKEKVDRYTPPDDYRANLIRFVRDSRERAALPVLCTSIVRRRFDEQGEFYDVHGVYPDIVREVAADLEVPLIDMHRKSEALVRALGPDRSKEIFLWIPPGVSPALPDGKEDNTHFSEIGATRMAELAVEGIRELQLGLAGHLRGSYRNPILFSDYSDPDVLRVGSDYYMVASSFQCVPGLPILHSKDLVHWTLIGHAISRLPEPDFDLPRHGEGVWAPSVRWHNGEFWIYYGDPDRGIFLVKARDPRGPWDPPVLVQKATGWIDPCPLWDDDGSLYLVHAWAKSRAGFNGVLTVRRLSPDGRSVVDTGVTVFEGRDRHPTIEGPKFYKRDGFYYVFAPAGGVTTGWQTVLRSRSIAGPYADIIALHQGSTDVNGPHQGAWVETQEGSSWFLHFQDAGPYGRVVHLEPLQWMAGWPVIGADPDGDGIGEPVTGAVLPVATGTVPIAEPGGSDEFDGPGLGVAWQWHANPAGTWYSLSSRPGCLRLAAASAPGGSANLWAVPNLLLQKFPAEEFTVTTSVVTAPSGAGTRAGLVVMGLDYACLVLHSGDDGITLRYSTCADADRNAAEQLLGTEPITRTPVQLRVSVANGAVCRFSYSAGGGEFRPVGREFQARKGKWIGTKVGLFALAPGQGGGYADVEWFRVSR